MIKVSDYVFNFIAGKGIDTVFTVSGGGCMHLTDSLGKNKDIKYVCNHHEQASAMAAEGYARIKNKPGCILVTTGPGGTNALTGVLCAYQDSIPMIVISGQVSSDQLSAGTGCRQIGPQEFDIISCVKPMVKYAVTVTDANDIKYVLQKAYHEATSGRPGPVWIDIPLDIQSSLFDEHNSIEFQNSISYTMDISKLETLKTLLSNSKRPVVVVGNGIRVSNTVNQLRSFLNKTKIPVLTGPHSAVDAVNCDYEFYAGRFGILGQYSSNHIIQQSDLVISLGSRLNPKMIGYDSRKFAPDATKFLIDIDLHEMMKLDFDNKIMWQIDLKEFFNLIKTFDINLNISEWHDTVTKLRSTDSLVLPKHESLTSHVSTYVFSKNLQSRLLDESVIVTSDGTAHVVPLKTMMLRGNQRLFSNEGTAPMGYGLPAAIGSYFAMNQPIICIEGDGSIMMNLQELETVRYHNIPMILFVLNNDGYLSIKLTQNSFFNKHLVACNESSGVSIPKFSKIAELFDFEYHSIQTNNEINLVFDKIFFNLNKPVLVEVFTDPNELHEPKVVAKGIDKNGKIIPGELTNMKI
jgi:acetolactate synthase-1/2/3 large subunit